VFSPDEIGTYVFVDKIKRLKGAMFTPSAPLLRWPAAVVDCLYLAINDG